jgi:uncharacterized protein
MLTSALLHLSVPAGCGLLLVLMLGGVVKGAIGVGLPLVSVPLLSLFLDLPAAIGLLTAPLFASNIGQAVEGGRTAEAVARLWRVMCGIVVGTVAGVQLLVTIDRRLLYEAAGALFILLALIVRVRPRLRLSRDSETRFGALIGVVSGLFGGIAGASSPPLTIYMVGLDLGPDRFVKYTSILFTVASLALMLALDNAGSMSGTDFLVSSAAILPIWLGMVLGRWLRRCISPAAFRDAVLCMLALSGLALLRRGTF